MGKNKMKEVAALLGLRLGEEFKVKGRDYAYWFDEKGVNAKLNGVVLAIYPNAIHELLTGKLEIIRLPFMPKEGELYYYVRWSGTQKLWVDHDPFTCDYQINCLQQDIGNCFRTREEAEAVKYQVYERLTGKNWDGSEVDV